MNWLSPRPNLWSSKPKFWVWGKIQRYEFSCKFQDSGDSFIFLWWGTYAMEAGGQARHFITTTLTKGGNLSTWVWALPLACAKLGGGAPVSYHHHFYYLYLLLVRSLVISWSS
jgi:hypothetical protein